ncbi:hypothetical protein GHT06_017023 [Daphnia sinensis]|uniref:Uncharacterized protein n=1 Tax=Daphnia sinensis TaxID=1820382 RepID=A0AAD5PRK3_9CRUS|nr:hypothetical protein GHT06_017023 [Daphnia sinensis]
MPIDVTLGALPNEEEEGGEDDSYEIRMQRGLRKAFAVVEGHILRAQEQLQGLLRQSAEKSSPVCSWGKRVNLQTASEIEEECNNLSGEEQSGRRRYPKRNRRPPQRLMLLPLLLIYLVLTPRLAIAAEIVLSNVFTDSEWVLVTNITFVQTDAVAADLKKWLQQKSTMADDSKPSENGKFHSTLIEHVHARALDGLICLQIITRSYEGLKATVCAPRRPRRQRGVMDGGGTVMNRLFWVATTDHLVKLNKNIEQLSMESAAIVHALEVHTSIINETVWEIEASAQIISKLQGSCGTLDREMKKAEFRLGNVLKETEHQWVAMGKGLKSILPKHSNLKFT